MKPMRGEGTNPPSHPQLPSGRMDVSVKNMSKYSSKGASPMSDQGRGDSGHVWEITLIILAISSAM